MKQAKFGYYPWVGFRYFDAPLGRRLLILGESHYGGVDQHGPSATIVYTAQYAAGKNGIRIYPGLMALLLGKSTKEISQDDRLAFWHSVSFYNYIQIALPSADDKPHRREFLTAEPCFRDVISTIKPERILACGDHRLYQNMPQFDQPWSANGQLDCDPDTFGFYRTSSKTYAFTMVIPHPSRGFSWKKHHSIVNSFIATRTEHDSH